MATLCCCRTPAASLRYYCCWTVSTAPACSCSSPATAYSHRCPPPLPAYMISWALSLILWGYLLAYPNCFNSRIALKTMCNLSYARLYLCSLYSSSHSSFHNHSKSFAQCFLYPTVHISLCFGNSHKAILVHIASIALHICFVFHHLNYAFIKY